MRRWCPSKRTPRRSATATVTPAVAAMAPTPMMVATPAARRRHACGGNGTAAGRYDRPAAPRTGFEELASASYRYHVGGVLQLLLRQVGGRRGDIAWCAYQFGDEVRDSSAVLDIAVEVETRCPALRPLVPGNGRRAVRVDEDTVAVEQQPVDPETYRVVAGHREAGYDIGDMACDDGASHHPCLRSSRYRK